MTRVLCVRLSAMGDLVQSLVGVQALHAARPELELVWLTQREHAPLLQGVPGIAQVVEHDRRGGVAAVLRTRRALRALGCAVALDLQGNGKSALFTWLSGARQRLGVARPFRQEPWSRLLLTGTVPVPGLPHPALVSLVLARALAPAARAAPPRLFASDEELALVAAAVRREGVEPARPFVVVVPGRPQDPRSLSRATIAAELARGGPVLLVAGPHERELTWPEAVPVWRQPQAQLRLLVGLGALVAQTGGEVVGPDQGPTHVLAAAGARTTVLYGPQEPRCTAPVSALVVRHPAPPPCMPCRERRCRHPLGPVCMEFARDQGTRMPALDWLADASS